MILLERRPDSPCLAGMASPPMGLPLTVTETEKESEVAATPASGTPPADDAQDALSQSALTPPPPGRVNRRNNSTGNTEDYAGGLLCNRGSSIAGPGLSGHGFSAPHSCHSSSSTSSTLHNGRGSISFRFHWHTSGAYGGRGTASGVSPMRCASFVLPGAAGVSGAESDCVDPHQAESRSVSRFPLSVSLRHTGSAHDRGSTGSSPARGSPLLLCKGASFSSGTSDRAGAKHSTGIHERKFIPSLSAGVTRRRRAQSHSSPLPLMLDSDGDETPPANDSLPALVSPGDAGAGAKLGTREDSRACRSRRTRWSMGRLAEVLTHYGRRHDRLASVPSCGSSDAINLCPGSMAREALEGQAGGEYSGVTAGPQDIADTSSQKPSLSCDPASAFSLEDLRLDPGSITMGDVIAVGASGEVCKAVYDGETVAVKILKSSYSSAVDLAADKDFNREISAFCAAGACPNLLHLRGFFVDDQSRVGIVTPFMERGSLHKFLMGRRGAPLPLKQVVELASDIATGMAFLHSRGFLHRDLKSENVLLNSFGRAVVCDFGAARTAAQTSDMTNEVGTYRWMAPEAFGATQWGVTQKSDVYSFGIILWELVTVRLPFGGMTNLQAAMAVGHKGMRPTIPKGCPSGLKALMQACWFSNPSDRPTFDRILQALGKINAR